MILRARSSLAAGLDVGRRLFTRRARTLGLATLLTACAGGASYNPTVFDAQLEAERIAASPIRTVVIPHVNLGLPSRNYLEDVAPRIDARVTRYLKDHGYRVAPQRQFRELWSTAARAYGDPVDPTTGKVNMKTFSQIMQSVRDELRATGEVDAFVFTDLVEFEVPFNGGLKHIARWDGVSRRPAMQGPGNAVSADFDWSRPAAVASLQITVFDMDLQRVFIGRGGLDATDAIDTRSSSGGYTRRRSILENEDFVDEGVALAFHPFIRMENWPGEP